MTERQKLTEDMRYLRSYYQWNEEDVAEIKQAAADNPDWWAYWSELADAHRSGYAQTAENGYIRLHTWKFTNQKEA